MYANEFAHRVALKADCTPETAKAVMLAMTEVLRGLELGEVALTPLGSFKMHHRPQRQTHLPGALAHTSRKALIQGIMYAKLHEGRRLIRAFEDDPDLFERRRAKPKQKRHFPGLDIDLSEDLGDDPYDGY